MKVWIYIILAVIAIIIFNLFFCFLYCKKKSKETIPQSDEGEEPVKESGLIPVLKKYLSGLVRLNLHILGKVPSHHIRKFILSHIFRMKIGKKAVIYGGFEIRAPWNIRIGDGTIIGDESKLDGRNGIIIGNNVNFSTGVWIWTEQHDLNDPYFKSNDSGGKVVIGDRVWVSSRTTILPGVKIGEGAVLAANALAVHDLDEYSVYGGVPAKKIGNRNRMLKYEFNGKYIPFY